MSNEFYKNIRFMVAILMVGIFITYGLNIALKMFELNLASDRVMFQEELIMRCNEAAAMTGNEKWEFTNCLKSVGLLEVVQDRQDVGITFEAV